MTYCFNQAGQPITLEACMTALFCLGDDDSLAAKRVRFDELRVGGEAVDVSTVWLGIDHGFGLTEKPIIFESMVFGGPLDETCRRYCTRDEAIAGHGELVAEILQLAQESL